MLLRLREVLQAASSIWARHPGGRRQRKVQEPASYRGARSVFLWWRKKEATEETGDLKNFHVGHRYYS